MRNGTFFTKVSTVLNKGGMICMLPTHTSKGVCMYTLFKLEEGGMELYQDEYANRHTAMMRANALVIKHGGIVVVENEQGQIVYEALCDGIDLVTVSTPIIMEVR